MARYVVVTYEGHKKPVGEKRGEFRSIDQAVAALAGHNLVRTGADPDLRAIAWEESDMTGAQKISYFQPQYVGADSE